MFQLLTAVILLFVSLNIHDSYIHIDDTPPAGSVEVYAKNKSNGTEVNTTNGAATKTESVSSMEVKTTDQENKVEAYNTNSEKYVGQMSENAVENSEALITCEEADGKCQQPTATPANTTSPTLTPTPTATPTTTVTQNPLPTIVSQPKKCEALCPIVACTDVNQKAGNRLIVEDCKCPCIPPPIY